MRNTLYSQVYNIIMKKVLLLIVALVIIAAVYMYSTVEPTPPPEPRENIGKHAYNATSGAYQGQILDVKTCQTTSSVTCYLTDIPSYAKPREHPIDNVDVREEGPTPTP